MPFALIADVEGLMQALGRCGNDDIGIVYGVANKEIGYKRRRCSRLSRWTRKRGIRASAGTSLRRWAMGGRDNLTKDRATEIVENCRLAPGRYFG